MNVLTRASNDNGVIVVNRPQFDTVLVSRHYSQKDGVGIRYVCTTELQPRGVPYDVFYRDTPHPEFGNKYFGLGYDPNWVQGVDPQLLITNADRVEDLSFDMIVDSEGHWHYSRYTHDCHYLDTEMLIDGNKVAHEASMTLIDGGRSYTRTGGTFETKSFVIKEGYFEVIPNE